MSETTAKTGETEQAVRQILHAALKEAVGPWSEQKRPFGYFVMEDGVRKRSFGKKAEHVKITAAPVWITKVLHNLSDGSVTRQIAWQNRDGRVRTYDLSAEELSDKKAFAALIGAADAPFLIAKLADAMDYLQHLYRINDTQLPREYVSDRLGWVTADAAEKFVYGAESGVSLSPAPSLSRHAQFFASRGTVAGWVEAMKPALEKSSRLCLLVLASLASPVLSLVGAPSFTVEVWGKTSSGKTSSLNIAASVWGKVGAGSAGLVSSWDNTAYYVEQLLQFHSALPVFLMDCHKAKPEVLEDVSYKLANGFGKGRGQKSGGIRNRATWNCVLLSDGERSLYSVFKNGGAAARVLSVHGSPLLRMTASEVHALVDSALANCGSVGHAYAGLLNSVDKAALRKSYSDHCERLALESSDGVSARSAQYFAAMNVALEVVCQLPEFSWFASVGRDALEAMRLETLKTVTEHSATKDGLSVVADWVSANPGKFRDLDSTDPLVRTFEPVQLFGYLKNGLVLVLQEELRKLCEQHFLDLGAMQLEWRDIGALEADRNRCTKVARIKDRTMRVFAFKHAALFPDVKNDTGDDDE